MAWFRKSGTQGTVFENLGHVLVWGKWWTATTDLIWQGLRVACDATTDRGQNLFVIEVIEPAS